jgi:nucleotide-binding universal stress UspA family protein
MNKILAAIDNSAVARPVLDVASLVADLLGAEIEAVHAREDGDQTARAAAEAAGIPLRSIGKPVVAALVEAGAASDVVAIALGARGIEAGRRPAGHVALQLALSLPKPLVVVPPEAAGQLQRILVPLNGLELSAGTLARTLKLAAHRKLEIIVLHVHDQESIPLFSDQRQHELECWAEEFLRRHCPDPELVRLETRVGAPGENVLQVADYTSADLIALGWSQDLGPGRAAVVRAALERSPVPLLLVPAVGEVELADLPVGHETTRSLRPHSDQRIGVDPTSARPGQAILRSGKRS